MAYNLTAEMFSEWAIGMVIIAVRLYARWSVGKGRFHWDDLFLGLVVIFWTFLTVFLYLCTAVHKSNIGLNNKTAMEIPDDEIADYRAGSIDAFIAWISYIALVWAFKGVLMFLYGRMTKGLWEHRLTISVAVFSFCTFMASIFLHLFICLPVHRSWQIKPYAGDNCTIRPLNYIIIETLSIITDIAVMAVPIPLIVKAGIPVRQKLLLCLLFSSGVFVMVAAVLRAYYSVRDISTLSTALGWASREAFVSAITVCAPGIKPLISNSRWFSTHSNSASAGVSNTPNGKRSSLFHTSRSHGDNGLHPYELSSSLAWGKHRPGSSGESQEHIVEQTKSSDETPRFSPNGKEIMVTTDVTLSTERN
ncbi:hypothetical protein N7462_004019 [Penicillium macrosclerotiorum]|uniref:uncharacterized protein n=1 Tax=Penicillium macrosclerotiorum TaxID=303699 RepID=UPI0025497409|nr:uncharacterized protein N7462_004019 [Penicillium macrosclerotiorum]KAJ5689627.1 hypothetical protein N7462_004019 [Penicillium macrosclerotiorum]